jgi:hypothetical protein
MTSADLDARLQNLSPAQRAVLERRLLERRLSSATQNAVRPREVASPVAVSYSQELLWLLSQVFNDGVAYNAPGAYRLAGPLDVDVLEQALQALVERHEILRTTYSAIDGKPMQMIHDSVSAHVRLVDLTGRPGEEQEAETAAVLKAESEHPFDLVQGPIFRATVIRYARDDHVFMLVLHHIATDGFSRGVLYRDLTALYDAIGEGRAAPLDPLPIQYADYAVWHRRWLDDGAAEAQLAYWKEKLSSLPSRLDLPTDYLRPAMRAYQGDHISRRIELDVREALRTVARKSDSTLFVALVSLFGTLLHRYTGQDDIVVGTPFAGRNRTEFEQMIGYFINPLALRLDLSGDPSFDELLGRTRQTVLDAFANADLPFETVVRETNPTRDLSQTPVFQAMIVLHNPAWETARPTFEPRGITATELTHEKPWSKFDLLLGMSERRYGLNTTWEYSTELFSASTVERMMTHFANLAASVVADPTKPLRSLSMLSPDERTQVIGWSGKPRAGFPSESIKELIEAQAQRTPTADAVVLDGERLTFDELNRRANRLAWRLKEAGVGPGVRVGVMMHKSLELVPAVLAVMKAGGAYIPLDPNYPADRLEFMLEDARPTVVLTHPDGGVESGLDDCLRIVIDESLLDEGRDEDPPTVAGGDDPAYVIYTSGSTGHPKGAVITNRSLASAFYAYRRHTGSTS